MVYHVIIALNSIEEERRNDQIISMLKRIGLEYQETRKNISQSFGKEFPSVNQYISYAKLEEQEAMDFYRENLNAEDLDKKIKHFYRNNVELLFDSGEKHFDPNEIWEVIAEHCFDNGKELPIMFVVMTGEENGLYKPFIPEF